MHYTFQLALCRQLTSSPYVTKHETDGGQKVGYYNIILSGKNDRGLWSVSTAEQFASSLLIAVQEVILHLHPAVVYTRSQQDLTSPKWISLPAYLVNTVELTVLMLYRLWSE